MTTPTDASILIVDDTPANLRLLSQVLEDRGYHVRIANHGRRALEAVNASPPDLILLDILMPEMTGYQVCEQLKAQPQTRDIPIIFISALDATADKINAFTVGGVDYITKPFQFDEVLARVRTHLALRLLQKSLELKNSQLEQEIAERLRAEAMLRRYTLELEEEKQKSERLLLNILPAHIAQDLKATGQTRPRIYENITVLFSDVVNFTHLSALLGPEALIGKLNEVFTGFDNIMERNGCERIKTMGDAYLSVCGMSQPNECHAECVVRAGLEMVRYLDESNRGLANPWQVRIGVHTGPVVGGVVGVKKYIYDVFGDTINTASRMEKHAEPMRVNISETTYQQVAAHYRCTGRQTVEVKGKGQVKMYFVDGELEAHPGGAGAR